MRQQIFRRYRRRYPYVPAQIVWKLSKSIEDNKMLASSALRFVSKLNDENKLG